jgi:hypothetical protein
MSQTGAPSGKHLAYYQVLEQLGEPGCAVCRLGFREAHRYLESVSAECVTDPAVRERLRKSFGFCRDHAHQLDAVAGRLSMAIYYDDFLACFERELEALDGAGWRLRTAARAAAPCPACETVRQHGERSLEVLALSIDDPEMAEAFEGSEGLCRPHLLALCRRLAAAARRRVIGEERGRLAQLRQELAEVKRKSDHRFLDEPWGEEKTSPTRAAAKISGE